MSNKTMPKIVKNLVYSMKKNSSEILIGMGITGMIMSTVMAVRATPKALRSIDEQKKKMGADNLTVKETVVAAWTCYIPAAITGTVSAICIIGAGSINAKRRAALATVYALSESALTDYHDKVVETIGEKKEQYIRDEIAKDRVTKNPVSNNKIIVTEKGNTLCIDAISGRYFKSDIETIRRAENKLNRQMRDELFISLNEFYYEIGLDSIPIGDELGWDIDNGYIDLQFSSQLDANGIPCLVVGYRIAPRYDYRK